MEAVRSTRGTVFLRVQNNIEKIDDHFRQGDVRMYAPQILGALKIGVDRQPASLINPKQASSSSGSLRFQGRPLRIGESGNTPYISEFASMVISSRVEHV